MWRGRCLLWCYVMNSWLWLVWFVGHVIHGMREVLQLLFWTLFTYLHFTSDILAFSCVGLVQGDSGIGGLVKWGPWPTKGPWSIVKETMHDKQNFLKRCANSGIASLQHMIVCLTEHTKGCRQICEPGVTTECCATDGYLMMRVSKWWCCHGYSCHGSSSSNLVCVYHVIELSSCRFH